MKEQSFLSTAGRHGISAPRYCQSKQTLSLDLDHRHSPSRGLAGRCTSFLAILRARLQGCKLHVDNNLCNIFSCCFSHRAEPFKPRYALPKNRLCHYDWPPRSPLFTRHRAAEIRAPPANKLSGAATPPAGREKKGGWLRPPRRRKAVKRDRKPGAKPVPDQQWYC